MNAFIPIHKNPGDKILSSDWNKIQQDLVQDIKDLENKIEKLREYIDNMSTTVILTNLDSPLHGESFELDQTVLGESINYGQRSVGLITKQWVPKKGGSEICSFGLTHQGDVIYYWAGAENGNKNSLDIVLEYVDGKVLKIGENLFLNDRINLIPPNKENPYSEFLNTSGGRWYKYAIKNPHPTKEIRYIKFVNTSKECNPRIGNVLHIKSKITQFLV